MFYVLYFRARQQSYSNATSYLLKCLDYFELWFGTMHPVVAEICHSLGKLLSEDENRHTRFVKEDKGTKYEYLSFVHNITILSELIACL